MRKIVKVFLIITAVFTFIGVISYWVMSDEELAIMDVNEICSRMEGAESMKELEGLYVELDSVLRECPSIANKVDSVKSLKSEFTKQVKARVLQYLKMDAFLGAKKLTLKRLKAPSTAKFCGFKDAKVNNPKDGVFEVILWVDAQNSFGAMIRSTYRLSMIRVGEGWNLLEFKEA